MDRKAPGPFSPILRTSANEGSDRDTRVHLGAPRDTSRYNKRYNNSSNHLSPSGGLAPGLFRGSVELLRDLHG
jgi:hypothetical protein